MKRYIVSGILLFVGCVVAFAPAGIVDRLVDQQPGVDLTDARGTIWRGQGLINADINAVTHFSGQLRWDFSWLSLLSLTPSYQWNLQNEELHLNGSAGIGFDGQVASIQGRANAVPFNNWLQIYDIVLSGDFTVSPTTLALNGGIVRDIDGTVEWSGGKVRYTLAGILRETELPPLTAYLDRNEENQPTATVFTQGGSTPLIIASLTENGFAKVSMTKLFTKLLRTPWPGSDPDHAVVLVVEEQLL